MSDLVEREAVLKAIEWDVKCTAEEWKKDGRALCAKKIRELPSITHKSGWIPVSKRLPKENEAVIASTKYGVYPEARYIEEYGWEWAYEAGADYWRELKGVTAWMPLPKQYEPQERSDKE